MANKIALIGVFVFGLAASLGLTSTAEAQVNQGRQGVGGQYQFNGRNWQFVPDSQGFAGNRFNAVNQFPRGPQRFQPRQQFPVSNFQPVQNVVPTVPAPGAGHHHHTFCVLYRRCSASPWRVYGTFDCPQSARAAARRLNCRGYQTRIVCH